MKCIVKILQKSFYHNTTHQFFTYQSLYGENEVIPYYWYKNVHFVLFLCRFSTPSACAFIQDS